MLSLVKKCITINPLALKQLSSAQSLELAQMRYKTHHRTGAFKPMPHVSSFGLIGILCSVLPGLFIGAAISKNVANFLEENDLFVPSDDDDDED